MSTDEETLQYIIKAAAEELKGREKARDEVMTRARKARQLSKQAILLDHNNQHDKAQSNIDEARRLIDEIGPHAEAYSELNGYEEVEAAHEEHAEAVILHDILLKDRYSSIEQAAATPTRYLLGLSDVPGELRREALDALRIGDLEKAEKHLRRMEQIFLHLVAMEDSGLLKGLRRKLDIARSVIEATRADVTRETGLARLRLHLISQNNLSSV